MKFIAISLLLFVSVTYAVPLSESFVAPREEVQHKWSLVPDNEGRLHLVDLNPIDVVVEPLFNADRDVFFLLFTRRNPLVGQRIGFDAAAIGNTNFNRNQNTRIIIHGFNNDAGSEVNTMITAAHLQRSDANVIVVDWSRGANTINYISARNRVNEVGPLLARFIDFLHQNGLIMFFSRLHIAGHSLGAHIAGIAGKQVTRGRVQVIIGLDPAGPLFDFNNPATRFASTDAVYTEGIRTNPGTLGFDRPLAMADFYPNWGPGQPGCGWDLTGACAHGRSSEFFAESINSNRFVGQRCSNWDEMNRNRICTGTGTAIMGGDSLLPTVGVFFLATSDRSPFALG
ncbi:unnamed protein product [Diamesa serratosioi]